MLPWVCGGKEAPACGTLPSLGAELKYVLNVEILGFLNKQEVAWIAVHASPHSSSVVRVRSLQQRSHAWPLLLELCL